MSEIETKAEAWKVTLTTDCECTDEDGNLLNDCFGCYEDNVYAFNELIAEWSNRRGDVATDTVCMASSNMNWDGVSGYAVTSKDKIADTLAINGQYRLDFKLDGATVTCTRYSHDEPTGAHFILYFVPDDTEHTH